MEWKDNAIVLSSQKYGENASLIRLLTQKHGIRAGMVRGAGSPRLRGIYQPGNLIEARWKARLSENLGFLSAELLEPYASHFLDDAKRLTALSTLCSMAQSCLPDHQEEEDIFFRLHTMLMHLKENTPLWHKEYVLFECNLLSEIGFSLDLSECAATGTTENLCYVSPKSGRAVSALAGAPYHAKLLRLPDFLLNESHDAPPGAIYDALQMTGYFLEKHSFLPRNMQLPAARGRLCAFFC